MPGEKERRVTFRQVLGHRDFARLWWAQAVSAMGDRLTQVALMIYVLELGEGSAMVLALFVTCQMLPSIICGPFVGVFVDRWNKRRTMVACDLLRAAIIAIVPFLGDAEMVYVIGFLMATVSMFFTPAVNAAIPELLESKREILVANSLYMSTKYFTDIMGFGVAASIVAFIGVKLAFVLDAVSFVFSAFFIGRIVTNLAAKAGAKARASFADFWEELRAGFRYHKENPVVLSLLISFSIGVLAMGGLNNMLIVSVQRMLGVPAFWWGYLLVAQAVAMFATGMTIGWLAHRVSRPFLVLAGFLGCGLCAIAFACCRSLVVAFVLYFLLGMFNTIFLTPSMAWIQEIVPFEFRGRVMALRNMVLNLAATVSFLAAGTLGDRIGVTPVLAGMGVILCLATIISTWLPGFRIERRQETAVVS